MVSANLERIADEFDDMVQERDFRGFITLAGIGAVGGVLAEMFHDRVAPRLNQPASPSGARGLSVSFGIKAAAAVLLAMAAARIGSGDVALLVGAAGVGAAIDAGVDLLDAVDTFRSASPARSSSRSSRSSSSSRSRSSRSRQPQRQSKPRASANGGRRGRQPVTT